METSSNESSDDEVWRGVAQSRDVMSPLHSAWNELREAVKNDQVPPAITDVTFLMLCKGKTTLDQNADVNEIFTADHVDLFHFGLLDEISPQNAGNMSTEISSCRGCEQNAENLCAETVSYEDFQGGMHVLSKGVPFFLGLCVSRPKSGNPYRFSAVHMASMLGKEELCAELVRKGANLLARDNRGNTALMLAIASQSDILPEVIIRDLCPKENISELVNVVNENGVTALHFAVAFGRGNVVDLLLKVGAKVDGHDRLSKGLSDEHRPDPGRCLSEDPLFNEHYLPAESSLTNYKDAAKTKSSQSRTVCFPSLVHLAVAVDHYNGNLNMTSKLLEASASMFHFADIPHIVDEKEDSSHRFLTSTGRCSLAVTVLTLGAKYLNGQSTDFDRSVYASVCQSDSVRVGHLGQGTPLHWAVRLGALPCMWRLLDEGLKVFKCKGGHPHFHPPCLESRTTEGATPLMVACRFAVVEAVRELIMRGACLNVCDRFGATPIHYVILARGPGCTFCFSNKICTQGLETKPEEGRDDGEMCTHFRTPCGWSQCESTSLSAVHETLDPLLRHRDVGNDVTRTRHDEDRSDYSLRPDITVPLQGHRISKENERFDTQTNDTFEPFRPCCEDTTNPAVQEMIGGNSTTARNVSLNKRSILTRYNPIESSTQRNGGCYGTRSVNSYCSTGASSIAHLSGEFNGTKRVTKSLVEFAVLCKTPDVLQKLIAHGEGFTLVHSRLENVMQNFSGWRRSERAHALMCTPTLGPTPAPNCVQTPLMCAASIRDCPRSRLQIANILIQHGAATYESRVLKLDWKTGSPAGTAFFQSDWKLLDLLYKTGGVTQKELSEMLDFAKGARFRHIAAPFPNCCTEAWQCMVNHLEAMVSEQPRSLLDLCRIEILHAIGPCADHVTQIRNLPLPPSLVRKCLMEM